MTTTKKNEKNAIRHAGKFVWFEVRTPTPEKTAKFFTDVVGWNISSMQMGEGEPYTLASTKNGPVAGVVKSDRAEFVSYVSVDDVDAAAKRVEKAGGKVKGKPFDVPTIGRMVEVEDPDGAAFFLYKSESGDTDVPPAQGAFLWNELWTKNESRALAFVTSVLGYTVEGMPMGGMTYNVLKTEGTSAAGVMKSPVKELPAHWLPYLQVDDVEAAQKRAKKLGASLDGEVSEVAGVGRFAFLRAPDGCRFAVMTPARA
jgi:predicted enzyme related to lactoylglutathione lyase